MKPPAIDFTYDLLLLMKPFVEEFWDPAPTLIVDISFACLFVDMFIFY
jgi:hypothetical protein